MKGIKFTIYTKLVVLFLLLSLLPLMALGIISYRNARQSMEENIGYKLEEMARLTMERVDHQLMRRANDLQVWANLEVMQDVLTGDADGRINNTVIDFKKRNPAYHRIICLDPSGEIVASSEPGLIGKTAAEAGCFQQTMTGKLYISDVKKLETCHIPAITFSVPIRAIGNQERIIGTISTVLKWEHLYPILENIRIEKSADQQIKNAHIMLINRDGLIIFAPAWERHQENPILKRNIMSEGYLADILTQRSKPGYTIETDEHDQLSLIGYAYSISHGDYPGMGWTVLALHNLEQAFIPVYRLRNFIWLSFIILAIMVTTIAQLFAKQLTIPIKSLTQAVRRIASQANEPNATFTENIPIKTSGEIGVLAESFNQMSQTLQDRNQKLNASYHKLEEYKNNLEDKVKERTAELEKKNLELRQTQDQLVQAGKMAAIGQLAAGVSHELNNPLGGILGYSQFILEKGEKNKNIIPDELKNVFTYVGYIERESQRCKTIVANLLKFSRSSNTDISELDINKVLEETFVFTRHQLEMHQVEVVQELAPDLPQIRGNEHQLQQVFTNLMVNAQQAMPDGGKLTVNTAQNNGTVEISFADTGRGIPKEHMDKLFDPFFTTKPAGEGTGLGLSVTYGIIRDMGGEITVKSEANKGTIFCIKLPVKK